MVPISPMESSYLRGFGNHFWTEAKPGSIPTDRHSPQKAPHGLYAEQISGSAFTAPRESNRRSWVYRIRPSVIHGEFKKLPATAAQQFCPKESIAPPPNQMRWNPIPLPAGSAKASAPGIDFVSGTHRLLESEGCNVYLYAMAESMRDRFFMNSDGEFLFIPETGTLRLATELGTLTVPPLHIAVIPQGLKFRVEIEGSGSARGYLVENLGSQFRLPELGPIGSNGLAYPEHFETPSAQFEDREGSARLVNKFDDTLWECALGHSPLDVVGWQGNLAPYRYDTMKFQTVGSITFDHPDPSIFTCLTSPSDTPGVANCDFVLFAPRWLVQENTFRPPWFHRNVMSEYMGLIHGVYDSKIGGGFVPGGGSLHNRFSAHGPDASTYERGSSGDLKPHKLETTMSFMAETRHLFRPTSFALKLSTEGGLLQPDYLECWASIKKAWQG